jgi:hypothetical protein
MDSWMKQCLTNFRRQSIEVGAGAEVAAWNGERVATNASGELKDEAVENNILY